LTVTTTMQKTSLLKSPGKENDARSLSSAHSKSKEKLLTPEERLKEIERKLAEVRQKRVEFETKEKKSDSQLLKKPRNKSPSKNNNSTSTTAHRPKPKKSPYYHPKLDYVLAEVVYSPYNMNPKFTPKREENQIHEKLRELKRKATHISDLPKEEQPFDMKEIERRFEKEVARYRVSYITPVSFCLFL
jgi:hypothetical protein